MTPERQKAVADHVALQLGAFRMWRTAILSAIGLVLCGVVAVILVGVVVSGAEGSDDVGLPAGFAVVLGLVCAGGLLHGISGIRGLAKDPLLVALRSPKPAVARVERIVDGWGVSVRFHLADGAQYRIYFDAAMADEVGRWLDRPA